MLRVDVREATQPNSGTQKPRAERMGGQCDRVALAIRAQATAAHYDLTFRNAEAARRVVHVDATFIVTSAEPLLLSLPAWTPGAYEISNDGKLLAKVLGSLQIAHQGRVAYLTVTRQMMAETGTSEVDTDAFVPYTLGIDHVQIGMMFTELPDGIKVNFRSKGDIPINELAKEFGGNGHKNASGARKANAQLADFLPIVVERSRAYTRKGDS